MQKDRLSLNRAQTHRDTHDRPMLKTRRQKPRESSKMEKLLVMLSAPPVYLSVIVFAASWRHSPKYKSSFEWRAQSGAARRRCCRREIEGYTASTRKGPTAAGAKLASLGRIHRGRLGAPRRGRPSAAKVRLSNFPVGSGTRN